MKVLCVAEKPSISKSITQILSGGQFQTSNTASPYIKNYEFNYPQTNSIFVVTCVSGHLTGSDFFDTHRKWNSCEAFDLFDAPVETIIPPDKKAIEQNLLNQARFAQVLMIWTDCDREGEHIGMEIARVCRRANQNIRVKRARFSAIIAQQIHHAAQNPVELDRKQADAVEARILLDLKVGAAFTRLQTMTLQGRIPQIEKSVVSYGPCQFPTLGFVVNRYQNVKNFVPEPFWYIYLSLTTEGNEETKFNWRRNHLFDQQVVVNLFDFMGDSPAVVTKVTNKTTKKWKPLPLTTVELQKAGSRLLKLAPKKVLDIAEKLYQQGFLSYPRTETDEFDPQFDHMALIAKQTVDGEWGAFASMLLQNGGGYSPPRRGKNNDRAHPPIHPTAHAANLAGDERRVYEYITRRYLACCSKDAEGWQTTVEVGCGGEEFTATGLVVREKNYLVVYKYDKWTGHTVPDFVEGQEFVPTVCDVRQGETTRPNYLTEADLVTLMDKNGIGTDATIAQHIQTIIDRDYVIERMEGGTKYLVPSTLGIGLIEGYNEIGLAKNVSKPQLRRETERQMVQVCHGSTTKAEMLAQSLEQYKEMFVLVRREFQKVTASVERYLNGQGGGPGGPGGGPNGGGGGGGPGGGGGGGDDDDYGGGGGGGGGARGRGRGRGATRATARGTTGRGRGRGGAASASVVSVSDMDDDDDDAMNPLIPAPRGAASRRGTAAARARGGAPATAARNIPQTAPIHVDEDWKTTKLPTPAPPPPPPAPAPVSRTSYSASNSNPPCECGVAAAKKVVETESSSKGRWYLACASNECGFFQWATDAAVASTSSAANVPVKRPYSATQESRPSAPPSSTGAARKCKCGEDGFLGETKKEGPNFMRKFWKCKTFDNPCGFFEWDDEPPRTNSYSQGGGGGAGPSRTGSYNNNASGSSFRCFKCDQEGHFSNACPNGDSAAVKRTKSYDTSGGSSSAVCFKCQQPGHYSSSCPNGASSSQRYNSNSGGGGMAKSTDECFKCGKTGHWSSNCPSDRGGSSTYTKRSYSSGTGTSKRGRGGSTRGSKRGRGTKKSKFGAADDW